MSTYTTKLTYKLSKGQTLTATSTFKGTGEFACQYNPNEYALMSVSSVTCTRGSTYKYPSSSVSRTLPTFDSIDSITYTISGTTPKTLVFVNKAGTQVSLGTTSGTCTTAQMNAIAALGSAGTLKLIETAQVRALGPTTTSTSVTSGWSPRYLYETGEIGDEKTRNVSKSASNSEYDSYTTTVVITIQYEYSSPEPPPGPTPPEPPEPGEFDYKNYTLIVEPGGVAIGNEVDGTKEKQKFLNCIETKFANAKTDIHADKMYTCKDGWTEVDLNTANVTTGQSTVGRQIGVAYRKEANGRVTVVGNVKFTSSASSINICTLPDEVKPTNVQYAFFNMSTINNDIGLVFISRAGNVNISWTRMNNSDSAITTTWPYCDFTFTYFV